MLQLEKPAKTDVQFASRGLN